MKTQFTLCDCLNMTMLQLFDMSEHDPITQPYDMFVVWLMSTHQIGDEDIIYTRFPRLNITVE